jgi:hypothetical protein
MAADLSAAADGSTPVLSAWGVTLEAPAELTVNYQTVVASPDSVQEGLPVDIVIGIYNGGQQKVENVQVALTAIEKTGITPLDTFVVSSIPPDSLVSVLYRYDTEGKRGSTTFVVEVDTEERVVELYRGNNIFSLSVTVVGDTLRPMFDITFDGLRILDGDFVSAHPEIRITVQDDSPLPYVDPANVTLSLDGRRIQLGAEPDSLFTPESGPDKATVVFRPGLSTGEHTLTLEVRDATGNPADEEPWEIRFRVETNSRLLDVVNFPNPFSGRTHFTFNLVGSSMPEEISLKVYTVAGRLIYDQRISGHDLHFGFNTIPWEGRDADGNEIANGLYFYKIAMRVDDRIEEVIRKLTKLR